MYAREVEAKRRRLEENRAVGECTSSTRPSDDDDELLGTSTGTLRGQSEIETEARSQREEALRQRKVNNHKALGLGCTDATQGEDALSPELEEFIHRSGKLNE